MSIHVSENGRLFALQTKTTTYLMKADGFGTLWHLYYGEKTDEADVSVLYPETNTGHRAVPGEFGFGDRRYSFETIPQEIPVFGDGDYRTSALRIRYADGSETVRLSFESYRIEDGKYSLDGLPASHAAVLPAQTLTITMRDTKTNLRVDLLYGVFESASVITRALRIFNETGKDVTIEKASVAVDFPVGSYDLITFYGRWARERSVDRASLPHGVRSVGSRRGNSSLQFNPSGILCASDTTETHGYACGFAFVYSGDFLLEAERYVDNAVRVSLGIHPDVFSYQLAPGESFDAPEVITACSEDGLTGVSHRFHDFINDAVVRGPYRRARRPVLLNNWEGTYFQFDGEKLISMAKEAADLGLDLFVLDDGWFGKRDSDLSGLGDWFPNEKKLGCTIGELGEAVRKSGVSFGIWFEPEGLSEDSEIYRAHPEYGIRVPGRIPSKSRAELLIDMTRDEVVSMLIDAISGVIRESGARYLKWDFNRSISDRYSETLPAERQGEFGIRYMKGVYRVLEALLTEFPDLLIEGCSSGGGRFDAGMLCYTPQIWTSDDTDPIERLSIQYGTSFLYPVSTMGSHVSTVPNHQTGRITPLRTRAVVAMSGTFGYELDVTKLSDAEKDEIRGQIALYHELEDVLRYGDYYRITTPEDENVTIWEQADRDGEKAVVSIVYHHAHSSRTKTRFSVQGLRDDAKYRVKNLFDDELRKTLLGFDPSESPVFSGRTLRTVGLYAPENKDRTMCDYESHLLFIERV